MIEKYSSLLLIDLQSVLKHTDTYIVYLVLHYQPSKVLMSTSSTLHMYHMKTLLRSQSEHHTLSGLRKYDLPVRPELLCNLFHLLLTHILPLSLPILQFRNISPLKCSHPSLHSKVASREDVHSLQSKTSEHLNTPFTQSSDFNQLLQNLFIRGLKKHGGSEFLVVELLSQAEDVFRFALRKTCCAENLNLATADLRWRGESMEAWIFDIGVEKCYELRFDGLRCRS